jgi:hypothetical protein
MKLDSTIVYQGDSLDASFEAFFQRHDSSNIGKFFLVKSLIEREPDSALAILEAIVPENNIETLYGRKLSAHSGYYRKRW